MNLKTIRRWAPWLALVIVFAIATSLLSWWQFSRREEKVAKIQLVMQNYDADPLALEILDWTYDSAGNAVNEWRQAIVFGHYLPEHTLLVRNRPLSGNPGFLQLVPFQLSDGRILIVERGWLPAASDITTAEFNPEPTGEAKQLVVRLRPVEADLGKESVQGQVASINPSTVSRALGIEMIPNFYGRLVSETPTSDQLPLAMPKPSLDEGNHLSYALQWLLFGIMAFGAFIWAYRNDRRLTLEAKGLIAPKSKRQTQADLDAVFEDQNG